MQHARPLTELSTFNLKNDTAHLLGTLIFLLGYDLDYKRQGIY